MADNQFIARNGLIALDDSQITGSLSLTGAVTGSIFSGSFVGDGSQLDGIDGFPFTGSAEITGSLTVTGSVAATEFIGDGSQLTGIEGFPYTGSAIISGSLEVTGSISTDTDATINSLTVGKGGGNLENNTVLGYEALISNVDGEGNTAIGYKALSSSLAEMGPNTAVGNQALRSNVYGFRNTAVGSGALFSNTGGMFNTAVGNTALVSNTDGNENIAIGDGTLNDNTEGNNNTGIGTFALHSNVDGDNNTGIGHSALYNNLTGSNNTAIGTDAGYYAGSGFTSLESVNNSIFVGYRARALNATGDTNEIVIGHNAVGSGSNTTVIGNNSTVSTTLRGAVSASIFSGSFVGDGSQLTGVTGASTASYVEYTNVANKPTLVSGSSQITYSGLTGIPSGIVSGSSQVTYSGLTGVPSGIVSGSAQITALGYATTGSNTFQGNQTVTGSLFISQNLIVAGSSSIQYISSSVLNIADNLITVNAENPSVRFGGLAVIDSGSSPQVSGSLLFDSIKDQWVFVHENPTTTTSSVLLMGPETYNDLGNETYLTLNRLPKGSGIEHLRDSNITDTGTIVSINSNTQVTGSLTTTGTVTAPTFSGALSGNATTSTALQTARTIGGVSFDGSANINLPGVNTTGNQNTTGNAATVTTNANLTGDVTSVGNATSIAAGVIVNADINASAGIVDTKLATISTAGKVSNSATTATSANTANAIVARDGSGNFSAGTITATTFSGALSGNASTATSAATLTTARNIGGVSFNGSANIDLPGVNTSGNQNTSGNAATATSAATWTTGRTITIGSTGKSVNGSANVSWSLAEIGAQAALTNPVTGTGTSGQVAYFTGTSAISSESSLFWNATNNRLGINQSSPSAPLHVGSDSSSDDANVQRWDYNANSAYQLILKQTVTSGVVRWNFSQINNSTAYNNVLVLDRGNVGIGTTSPSFKLSVDGGDIKLNSGNASANYYLYLNKKEGQDGGMLLQRDNTNDWQITNIGTSGNLIFYSYGSSSCALTIARATGAATFYGNVGINTASPSSRLSVCSTTACSTVVDVQGCAGQLFSVTDNLVGEIFAVSDISGIPILGVNSNGTVSVDSKIAVGANHTVSGAYASVLGGVCNTASGCGAVVGGGGCVGGGGPGWGPNIASGINSFIGGGSSNCASGTHSVVAGGGGPNFLSRGNTASGCYSAILGGMSNRACSYLSTVVGGGFNTASSYYSTVGGGRQNCASGNFSTVAGGFQNTASNYCATVGGGGSNTASGPRSTVSGGYANTASGTYSTIAGGFNNCAGASSSTISGGYGNITFTMFGAGNCAVIGGGLYNNAAAEFVGILGGRSNLVTHACSFAIGVCLTSTTSCYTFVNNLCNVGGGTSDYRLKENIKSIPYGLSELSRLQPVCYNFKTDESKKTKYGFIAQCIQEVMPDLIYNHPTDTVEGSPVLQFDKEAVWASMVNAIKELKQRVEELESKIN